MRPPKAAEECTSFSATTVCPFPASTTMCEPPPSALAMRLSVEPAGALKTSCAAAPH